MGQNGIISHEELLRQPVSFEAMLPYPLAPTDLDGLIEVSGIGYILIEVKRGHTQMPRGQQIALESMVMDFHKAGKRAVLILLRHEQSDPTEMIFAAMLPVTGIYDGKGWREPRSKCMAHEFVKQTIAMWKRH